jgi:hypothetical protein
MDPPDPQLNGSFQINKGLRLARGLLLEIVSFDQVRPTLQILILLCRLPWVFLPAASSSIPSRLSTPPISFHGVPLEHEVSVKDFPKLKARLTCFSSSATESQIHRELGRRPLLRASRIPS